MTSDKDPAVPPPAATALARVVLEIEEYVAARGWDAPVRVFALVRTAAALTTDPELAGILDEAALEQARHDPHALTVIEQEQLPAAADLEDLLAQLAWPEAVDGAALSVERLMLPPAAEQEAAAIEDEAERLSFLHHHPQRSDVRLVVGALRSGPAWCAVRSREHDAPDSVAQGPDLVPGLIEALRATFL